jgi:PAS domain S-box-containing protein
MTAMPRKAITRMSRQELLHALRELERRFTRRLDELTVHQEELRAQHEEMTEAQAALSESRDRYADLYDFAPIAFVTLDAAGVIAQINLPASRLLGLERSRVLGLPFISFVTRADRRAFLDHMMRCRETELRDQVVGELLLQPRHGDPVPVELQSRRAPVGARNSYPTAIVDLTDRKRLEAERLRAQDERVQAYEERLRALHEERALREASDAKDRFLATLSHELRAPLTSIVFALGSLRERPDLPVAIRTAFQLVSRNVDLEVRLIDDLLDVTRIQHGKLCLERRPLHAHELVREIVEMLGGEARTRSIDIRLDLTAAQAWVDADAVRLRQVLWNIVTNGLHHTPPGGQLTLQSRNPEPGRLALVIRDTGDGIPREMLERVFEPFEQAGPPVPGAGNLGLGLAISKGIIDAHGGRISADSEGPGRGATFTVELPASAAGNGATPARAPRPATESPRRILLVEDNHDNGMAVAEYLRLRGYDVQVAASVRTALAIPERTFDVVLSDIGLPDGTGHDLVRQLRERGPVRAVALSGYGTRDDVARSLDAGFSRHLTKPVDPEVLIDTIEEVAVEEPIVFGGENGSAHARP